MQLQDWFGLVFSVKLGGSSRFCTFMVLFQAEANRYIEHKIRVCKILILSASMLAELSSHTLSSENSINPF